MLNKTSDTIFIFGRGVSCHNTSDIEAKFPNADQWRLNHGSAGQALRSGGAKYHFELHNPAHHSDDFIASFYKEHKFSPTPEIIRPDKFPYDELRKRFNNQFWANTIALQIGLALLMDYSNIVLSGADQFNLQEQNKHEESCVVFWVAIARAMGKRVLVSNHCDIFKHKTEDNLTCWDLGTKVGSGDKLEEPIYNWLREFKFYI
jgi:hypothetical protein